jgi:NADPH-dependent 2,4-dienoyl-CoA reductase/sulfur reductase-like enzyme/peroxiredoxin family protein/rhodanese-related sulfurtransferase/TusA-related sulfurtransferase
VQTVSEMATKFNLDIRILSEVTKINRAQKTVEIKNLKTGEIYEAGYDRLVLSPGASPIKPSIPGIENAEALFTLRNIPDTDKIKSFTNTKKPKKAAVIGGGFIGIEMAENLWELGIEVTLIEMSNQIMAPLDFEMASILHAHLLEKGVKLILEDGVKAFEENGQIVKLNSGRKIETDMILLAIGVKPENKLAKDAGLKIGERGGIQVNEHMQTEDPFIFAIGDAIEVSDYINGRPTQIPLAWPANRQGRIVADYINGIAASYKGTLGTSIAKVFDLTAAVTGNNEKTLKKLGIAYEVIHIHPGSHAGYYPGSFPISLKVIFDKQTGKIYGAQAVSYDGADKRIDVIATAIKGGLTIFDLPDLELSYAPPYSSAKDPVNMAGYTAANIAEGLVETVQWFEINEIVQNGGLLIDVREPIEREMGFIPGSINIPLGELRDRIDELPKDQTIYLTCQVGLRGYLGARILTQYGLKVKNLDGGIKTYSAVFEQNYKAKEEANMNDAGMFEIMNNTNNTNKVEPAKTILVDACGLQCPGPIMKVYRTMNEIEAGDILEVHATDPGFTKDIKSWSLKTGNTLLRTTFENKKFKAFVQKGTPAITEMAATVEQTTPAKKEGATLIVFSGDLDKTIASFIIALGAAAMGKKVTMFFTFWGLNVLRRNDAPPVEKDMMEKMFGMMMPKGISELPLSKMNMGGMGAKMINHAMQRKNVDSLDTLMKNAMDAGVKLVACTMSMDIMGIKKEELIDGVDLGGVAAFLGDADDAGLNLFI